MLQMTNEQGPDEKDIALFRHSVGDVTPISQNTAVLDRPKSRRKPVRIQETTAFDPNSQTDGQFVPEEFRVSAADRIEYRRPGLQDKVFRKLKRGQLQVSTELDLHGMTAEKARQTLEKFMGHTRHYTGQTCVRIIHGKGYGSKDGRPVIKQYIQMWLREHKKVLAYSSCQATDGGTGAVYVLLKAGNN
jgi:DNA-nicking Smr family endonuclease